MSFLETLPSAPIERRDALQIEADRLKSKSASEFTSGDVERVDIVKSELDRIRPAVEKAKKSREVAEQLAGHGLSSMKSGRLSGDPRQARVGGFVEAFKSAFQDAAPAIGGFGVQKSLVPGGSVTVEYGGEIVESAMAATAQLSSLVTQSSVEDPSGAYLQQTARTNAAAPVQIGATKPTSTYTLGWNQWKLATIAHMSEPVAKQWLADFSGLQDFIAAEMAFGVATAVDNYVLNGGTAEDGTAVTGILNSDIAEQAFNTDALLSIRSALGALDVTGITANGIVLNPADWEAIETLTDTTGRYLLPLTPQENASRTLWGRPVVLVPGVPAGTGLVGDFRFVNVLNKGAYEITWAQFGQGVPATLGSGATIAKDLYESNQVRFRAEGRYGVNISSLAALRKVALTDGA